MQLMMKFSIGFLIASFVLMSTGFVFGQTATATATPIVTPTLSPKSLELIAVLGENGCAESCLLGLTLNDSPTEVVEKLEKAGIQYVKYELGLSGQLFSYSGFIGFDSPVIDLSTPDGVIIFTSKEDRGITILIILKDVTVEDIVATFGAPTFVADSYSQSYQFHYVKQGFVFNVEKKNQNYVWSVTISSSLGVWIDINGSENSGGSDPLPSCFEPTQLCALATATLDPLATPFPTLTPVPTIAPTPILSVEEKLSILFDDDCKKLCILGIEAGVTTRVKFWEIFTATNVFFQEFYYSPDIDRSYKFKIFYPYNEIFGSIYIDDDMVSEIRIRFQIPVKQFVEIFGSPTKVAFTQAIDSTVVTYYLHYPDLGMVATVVDNLSDEIWLTSDPVINGQFESLFGTTVVEQSCNDYSVSPCIVATATPSP